MEVKMRYAIIFSVILLLISVGCAPPVAEDYPLERIGDKAPEEAETEAPKHMEPTAEPIEDVEEVTQEPAEPYIEAEAPIELEPVEVSEYNGVKLGEIDDFRDNSILGPQYIDKETYRLEIGGLVDNAQELTYAEVLNHDMYSKIVTLNCVEGWSVRILWEGVLLKDVLADAMIKDQANTVILYAHDGYSTSLPLDYIIDNNIMLAYKMNNVTIPPERGFPFQLVAEQKWGYKWIKWITRIELSDDPEYEGFWEQRGWDNDADLNKSPR
jgi:DMSO/TMAO reductase YedYZ molybdopterin-dependent catalytic subunit